MANEFHCDNHVAASPRRTSLGAKALVIGFAVAVSSPAVAEVCDKVVGESWHPHHGPVWLLNVSYPPIVAWVFIAFAIAAIVLWKRRWIGYAAAALFAISAVLSLVGLDPDEIVMRAARSEGCLSNLTDKLDASIWTALAVASVILAHTMSRKRATP